MFYLSANQCVVSNRIGKNNSSRLGLYVLILSPVMEEHIKALMYEHDRKMNTVATYASRWVPTRDQKLIHFSLLQYYYSFVYVFSNDSNAAFVSLFSQKLMTSQVSNSVSPFFSLLSLSLLQIIHV